MYASSAQSLISNAGHTGWPKGLLVKKITSVKNAILIETIAIPLITIALITLLVNYGIADEHTLVIPAILIAAAMTATFIRRRSLRHIGLNLNNAGLSLRLLFWTSILILPLTFLVLQLISSFGFHLPLQQDIPQQGRWIHWLLFQFLSAAFAEEVFFRGFMQSNLLILSRSLSRVHRRFHRFTAVCLSALCFAAAHIIIRSDLSGIMTFFPGLVFGWLFLRTRSLLAPVLFHGFANICYCLFYIILSQN